MIVAIPKRIIFRQLTSFFYREYRNNIGNMKTDLLQMKADARNIFQAGVNAVLPQRLISSVLRLENDTKLFIDENYYYVNENIYVIGFGKAVSGMARAVEDILGRHLVKGLISVPVGTVNLMKKSNRDEMLPRMNGKIKLMEGAKDNLPDDSAWQAAINIVSLVSSLNSDDLLLVLISGGGSALLPFPIESLTLEEKQRVIKQLSSKGATIEELNSVRKRLSLVKGGGIAKLAYPAKVIGLILSDIVGDPIDLISSAPTVRNTDAVDLPLKILEKYSLLRDVSPNVLKILQNIKDDSEEKEFNHVHNKLIGTNHLAISGALKEASKLNYIPIILSSNLRGIARNVGEAFGKLSKFLSGYKYTESEASEIINILGISQNTLQSLIEKSKSAEKGLCIIGGGETVVIVKGTGKGGRNQEMALAAAITMSINDFDINKKILFLSAGTDGIDGPTPAAGALVYPFLVPMATNKVCATEYLENNDSYNFYSSVNNGEDLIVIGHTGTNVMDLQILLIG